MSAGDYHSFRYQDNNFLDRELKVSKRDDEVNAEQAAVIILLDRIATALEHLVEMGRKQRDGF